jgi:mannose-1-phosphate guanylyltransferase
MKNRFYTLVMAGGKGTRLWPESTNSKPKQYMALFSKKSLIEETLDRFEGLANKEEKYIVTVSEQKEICSSLVDHLVHKKAYILEPSGRNTAPCILLSLATLKAHGASDSDVVAIVPSDHVILNTKGFQRTISYAKDMAILEKKIVTIGITPHFPHTGFGYIQRKNKVNTQEDACAFSVQAFKEKPNFETAKTYVQSGEYYWNAGMFVATIGVLIEEFKKHAPEVFKFYHDLLNSVSEGKDYKAIYNQIPENSIDYAVMEKTENILVVPSLFDWNDLGSWDALESITKPIENNFIINQKSSVNYLSGSEGNIVYAPNQFIALANVQDMIIVSNERALMIMPKKDAQKVKDIYQFVKEKKLEGLV